MPATSDIAGFLRADTQGLIVPGYKVLEILFESDRSMVVRARSDENEKTYVLKILQEQYINSSEVARFRHEYKLLKSIKAPFVIRCYGLGWRQGAPFLILEDGQGEALKVSRPYDNLSLGEKLQIAIKVSGALGNLHHSSVVHKDVNPSNILYNPQTCEVRLIDFGIASSVEREEASLGSPQHLEGSLPYISPEQTGRMNRSVDYRSDLYSFGMTLYELFVGRVPFDFTDRLKMIHHHIAKNPPRPRDVRPTLPAQVSDIIMKLIQKAAENRYRSAWGVRADLQKCLDMLNKSGKIRTFELGEKDIPDRFVFPEKLYGRETQVSDLLGSFNRVCDGEREIALVKGYSGLGKSSLIKEIYKPITGRRGFFVSGKHDQMNRTTPFHGLIYALKDLLRQVLAESEVKLDSWRNKILEAVGQNGALIIDVLPELEQIIGPQPRSSSSDRVAGYTSLFNMVFKDFIHVFCRRDHPLVVFLDDLHWVDPSTLSFLKNFLCEEKSQYIFLIGSYRDGDVDEGHGLHLLIRKLSEKISVRHIELHPLESDDIATLVRDCLFCDQAAAKPLAKLLREKTGGNPFFIEQFIKDLIYEGNMWFDPNSWSWSWDLQQINDQNITDNVADLLAKKIGKLKSNTQVLLQLAACIGRKFDTKTLFNISEMSFESIFECLQDATRNGFIRLSQSGDEFLLDAEQLKNESYELEFVFSHDRFHQAAHDLIPGHKRITYHYRIGHILMKEITEQELDQRVFDIVNQLNFSIRLIQTREEQFQLAKLNQRAGTQALSASAYDSAYQYFQTGLALVGAGGWAEAYSVTLKLHCQGAESAYLASKYDDMNRLIGIVINNARNLLDVMSVYRTGVYGAIARGRLQEASVLGCSILKKMGTRLPERPTKWDIFWAFAKLKLQLWKKPAIMLLRSDFPRLSDPEVKAKIDFQLSLIPCFYRSNPELIPLSVCDALITCLRYGKTDSLSYILASYGALESGILDNDQIASKFMQLARKSYDEFGDKRYEMASEFVHYAFVSHTNSHIIKTIAPMEKIFLSSIQMGEQHLVAWVSSIISSYAFFGGRPLSLLERDLEKYRSQLAKIQKKGKDNFIGSLLDQVLLQLTTGDFSGDVTSEYFDISVVFSEYQAANDQYAQFILAFMGMYLKVLAYKFSEAIGFEAVARKFVFAATGTFFVPLFTFYQTLIQCYKLPRVKGYRRLQLKSEIKNNIKKMRKMADRCSINHEHRWALMSAEFGKALGNNIEAQKYYELAGKQARAGSFFNDAGLAYELAAKFYSELGQKMISVAYIRKSRYYYERWGAKAKVAQIERAYPELHSHSDFGGQTSSTNSTLSSSVIDITTLKKALVAIAEEKIHSLMIEKIVSSAIEFAGAERGILLLKKDDDSFFVEGDGSIERDEANILQSMPLEDFEDLPKPVVNYVKNTGDLLVIPNAQVPSESLPGLTMDPYIQQNQVKSVLCMPIRTGLKETTRTIGILYLENRMASNTFTAQRVEILEIICLAAAGRLELSLKAATDGLTGLYNHEYFQNILNKEMMQSKRHLRNLSLVMIDIDHFKSFNDQWGHQVGDLVLKKVAAAIQNVCRKSDVVARYGGEEMSVILPETGPEMAELVSERIRARIEASEILIDGNVLKVTASLGVASLNEGVSDVDSLINFADKALYQAKENGRNQIKIAP